MADGSTIEDDIRETLRTIREPAPAAAEPVQTASIPDPAQQATAEPEAAPGAAPEAKPEASQSPPEGRARGPDGKFIAKTEESAQTAPTDQPAAALAEAPQGEPIRPPAAWSAKAKSKFATLDPDIQQEVLKREADMDKGLQQRAGQLKQYEPLDAVLAPYRDRFAVSGVSAAEAVQRLLNAQNVLERDPVGGLRLLAQQFGVSPEHIFAQPGQPAAGQQQQPQAPTLPPEVQAALEKVNTLEQTIQQQQQAAEAARNQDLHDQVEKFRSDPKHIYFDNVREEMGLLLEAGKAKDLAEAYDMACWAKPDIRALIQQDQSKAEQQRAAAEAAERAARARHAAGSVTGSPGPGAPAPKPSDPNSSLVDDVRAAWNAASSRA